MYEISLLISALCLIGVTFYFVRKPSFSIYHPLGLYIIVHGLLFVVRPIVGDILHYSALYTIYDFTPSLEDRLTVIYAANLCFLCFSFFSLRVGNMPMTFRFDRYDGEERRRLSQVFVWTLVLVMPIGLYSLMTSYNDLAGGENVKGMLIDHASGYSFNTESNGYLTDAQGMLGPCAALIIWMGRFRLLSWFPLAGFILFKAGTGGRGPFVLALLMAGLLYCFENRRRFPPTSVIVAAAAGLLLFTTIGADRGATLRELFGQKVTVDADALHDEWNKQKFLESMDWANMEYFEYLVYVIPHKSGTHDYFLDNFQLFTDPIPRVFWTEKPKGEPFRKIFLFNYGNPVGMTRSLPGEGWYALGWFGVIIWSSLWGYVTGSVYRRFAASEQTTMQTCSYMIFWTALVIFYRDGLLVTLMHNLGVYLAPVALWYIFARLFAVPKAAQLRREAKLAARRAEQLSANADLTPADLAKRNAQSYMASLPAAVRRRRLALQGQPTTPPSA